VSREAVSGSSYQPRRRGLLRLALVAVLAVTAGAIAWILLRDNGDSSPSRKSASSAKSAPSAHTTDAKAASVSMLRDLAASVKHPIFWLGPKSGYTYELTRTSNGKIYLRYLPHGVSPGAKTAYLTVATYPFTDAYAAVQQAAAARGAVKLKLAHNGLAVLDKTYPESVHLAYPDVDYQVEVYDPTPRRALRLVSGGKVDFFGTLTATPSPASKPAGLSLAGLKSFAHGVGHPVYWAGPKSGYTYEVTQTPNGDVYVRYLPTGVKAGAAKPYLTVVTYPFPDALAALRQAAKGYTSGVFKLSGGGLAVVDRSYPKSVHVAFPRSAFQIEVFDPSPSTARSVATSGGVVPLS
jgi:hypothetical protein